MAKGKKTGGRAAGEPNKITKTVREAFLDAFNHIQMHPKAKLSTWGAENPDKFYPLAAKLIPTEITAAVKHVYVMRSPNVSPDVEHWQQQHPEVTLQ